MNKRLSIVVVLMLLLSLTISVLLILPPTQNGISLIRILSRFFVISDYRHVLRPFLGLDFVLFASLVSLILREKARLLVKMLISSLGITVFLAFPPTYQFFIEIIRNALATDFKSGFVIAQLIFFILLIIDCVLFISLLIIKAIEKYSKRN